MSKQTRSPAVNRTITESFKRTRESSPISSFTLSLPQTGSGGKQRHHESDLDKVFFQYVFFFFKFDLILYKDFF